jgi:hypothetical protein
VRLLLAFTLCTGLLQAQAFVLVSPANPRYLELSDGSPYIPIGPNIAWERFATDEKEIFARTEARFRQVAANGGNFARVYLSHPFYAIDPTGPQDQIDLKLRRMDRLLALARRYHIRVKLCLEHFRSTDPAPVLFPGSVSFGRPDYTSLPPTITDFFNTPASRQWYLKRLDLLAQRYSNEPAIYGWELWNEINAVKGTGWEEWTRFMLPELKRRFPHHLSLQTLGSFDSNSSTQLYQRFSTMPGNEIAQVHRYLDLGAKLEVCHGPFDTLAADAITALRSFTADRPVLFSEIGAVEPNHAGPSKLYEKDREGILIHDGIFAPFFAGAAGPGQFWHWQDYIEKNNLWYHYGRFAEAIKGLDPRAEQFQPATLPHPRLRVYLLKGRHHSLLWLRDSTSDWRAELEQGTPAPTLSGLELALTGAEADIYNPWTGRHAKAAIRAGKLTLPPFRRSLVIRIPTPSH